MEQRLPRSTNPVYPSSSSTNPASSAPLASHQQNMDHFQRMHQEMNQMMHAAHQNAINAFQQPHLPPFMPMTMGSMQPFDPLPPMGSMQPFDPLPPLGHQSLGLHSPIPSSFPPPLHSPMFPSGLSHGSLGLQPGTAFPTTLSNPMDHINQFSKGMTLDIAHQDLKQGSGDTVFHSQTFVSSSVTGPDGQVKYEKYFDKNAGQCIGGESMSQRQQSYQNNQGEHVIAEERMLNDQGRKMIQEQRGSDVQERSQFYNMDHDDVASFDRNWAHTEQNTRFIQNQQRLPLITASTRPQLAGLNYAVTPSLQQGYASQASQHQGYSKQGSPQYHGSTNHSGLSQSGQSSSSVSRSNESNASTTSISQHPRSPTFPMTTSTTTMPPHTGLPTFTNQANPKKY